MKRICLSLLVATLLTILLPVSSCWAKAKGYCYIVSYSLGERAAYFTPVFVATVSGATYSDEEFVAEVVLIRNMERQFQNYLSKKGTKHADAVTSARVAYRTQAIADRRLADEKGDYTRRGFSINDANDFTFKQ